MPNLDLDILKIMNGDTEVLKVMQGDTKVWPSGDIAIVDSSLTNVSSSVALPMRVNLNEPFSTTLTPTTNYTITSVSVTMGGEDVTSSAYSGGVISIAEVTGDIVVTALAETYIMDDLTYWFDGINKGDDSTRWTDLVSAEYFTLTTHSTVDDSSVIMDGAGCITCTSGIAITNSVGTIETCINRTNGGTGSCIIFTCGGNTGLSAIVGGGGMCYFPYRVTNEYSFTNVSKFIYSANAERCIYNGEEYTSKGSNTWSNVGSVATLGGRQSGSHYYFNGKVHSIRVYNRRLTKEEMLHNQRIDNIRFNLELEL